MERDATSTGVANLFANRQKSTVTIESHEEGKIYCDLRLPIKALAFIQL